MAKQKKETIKGTEFVFQHPGARWYVSLSDRTSDRFGNEIKEDYVDELLENVVVKPQDVNSLDDFGPGAEYDMSTLNKLVEKCEIFLNS